MVSGRDLGAEIGFNNFIDPQIATGRSRFYVDNAAWAAVALLMFAASFWRAWIARRFEPAIRIGLWSGFVSGLIACLLGLMLPIVWMRFLLRDPINIEEYGARAAGAHAQGMASYLAYETLGGALAHLIVLGIVMGFLLGWTGGALAMARAWPRP